LIVLLIACNGGPDTAKVMRIIDGDTIELEGGERIRYLMVNTPETTGGKNECYGSNATTFNSDTVLNKEVELRYDVQKQDQFGRTLAYVTVDGMEINRLIVERGYGCVLHIPPNGDDRLAEFNMLEQTARLSMRGVWGACMPVPCQ
jgi:micrococcal nuclease